MKYGGMLVCMVIAFDGMTSPPSEPGASTFVVVGCPGDTRRFSHPIVVSVPARIVDMFIAVDTSTSMKRWRDGVVEVLSWGDGLFDLNWDLNVGVATFRDYPIDPYGDAEDYAWRLERGVGDCARCLQILGESIVFGGGGDRPEAYTRALFQLSRVHHWRAGAERLAILLGDGWPHDDDLTVGMPAEVAERIPDYRRRTGYPPMYLDPGPSGDSGDNADLSDDLDFQEQLESLADNQISLIAVVGPDGKAITDTWQVWANKVGGHSVMIDLATESASTIVDQLAHAIDSSGVNEVRVVSVVSPSSAAAWLHVQPARADVTVMVGQSSVFTLTVTAAVLAEWRPGEIHEASVRILADGVVKWSVDVSSQLSQRCSSWTLWLPSVGGRRFHESPSALSRRVGRWVAAPRVLGRNGGEGQPLW